MENEKTGAIESMRVPSPLRTLLPPTPPFLKCNLCRIRKQFPASLTGEGVT